MALDRRGALRQLTDAAHADHAALTIELSRRYLARWPDDRFVLGFYADALTSVARYAEARAIYDRVLTLAQDEAERGRTYGALGHLHQARFEAHEAEQWYRRAIAARPLDAGPRIYLGGLLAKAGRLEEAAALYAEATRCPDGALEEAWLNVGLLQRARGDYVGALESFRHALLLDPEYTDAKDALVDIEQVLFEFPPEPTEPEDGFERSAEA